MRCVLDASAALAFVLADEFIDAAERILDHVMAHGAVVPPLWQSEVANGLLSAWKRDRITEAGIAHALVGLERLRIERTPSDQDSSALIVLGRSLEVSAYDATYLLVAMQQGLPLATLDRRLAEAAGLAGVDLVR